jgi:hypothetical protein
MINSRICGLTYSMRSNWMILFVNVLLLLGQHHPALEDGGLIDALGWRHWKPLNGNPQFSAKGPAGLRP